MNVIVYNYAFPTSQNVAYCPRTMLGKLKMLRSCVFIPDGLFGQCRSSKQDLVQYQVSVPVLKRMQEVLKQLMLQGEMIHENLL